VGAAAARELRIAEAGELRTRGARLGARRGPKGHERSRGGEPSGRAPFGSVARYFAPHTPTQGGAPGDATQAIVARHS
jgi:hypothetical protein